MAAAAMGIPAPAQSQQACQAPSPSDFSKVDLSMGGLSNPVDLQVAPDGRIFIAEIRSGEIKIFRDGGTPRMTVAGKIPVATTNEQGLQGLALDPDFARNGWIYARYSPAGKPGDEVARFTLAGDRMDLASRKILLSIPRDGHAHLGAGMAFDLQGNLLITTGCDTHPSANGGYAAIEAANILNDAQKSAGNTNDLRGKILRIKPKPFPDSQTPPPGEGSTYEIPAGNLWETIRATMPDADLAKVRKETLATGFRNPYRIAVDPRTGWVLTGEVGPDAGSDNPARGRAGHDEINLVREGGGFYGWPFCNGNNFAYNQIDPAAQGAKFDCSRPVNLSPNNTGISVLPPAKPPLIWYARSNKEDFPELGTGGEAAMVGDFYRYDPNLKSAAKFPPYFHGKLLIWDWARNFHRMLSLDGQGNLQKTEPLEVAGHAWGSDIAARFGVNGALYVLQWATMGYGGGPRAFYKIEYRGPLNEAACASVSLRNAFPKPKHAALFPLAMGSAAFLLPVSAAGVDVFDLEGKKVWSYRRPGARGPRRPLRLRMPEGLARGVGHARFITEGEYQ